jgi:hypothetical protein
MDYFKIDVFLKAAACYNDDNGGANDNILFYIIRTVKYPTSDSTNQVLFPRRNFVYS